MSRRDRETPEEREARLTAMRERRQAELEQHRLRQEMHLQQHLEQLRQARERQERGYQQHLERVQQARERHLDAAKRASGRAGHRGAPPYMWQSADGRPVPPEQAARMVAKEMQRPADMEQGRKERFLRIGRTVVFMTAVLIALCACWSLAYFATNWAYGLWGWDPHGIIRQVANSVLGFAFFGAIMASVSPFIRKRQLAFLYLMLDAMKRISRGDFRIHITVPRGANEEYFTTLARSINDMAANLEKLETMRQEFISNVSHEIQSPLTSIGGFARILKNEEVDQTQLHHYAGIIEQESQRLSKLSENMLRLASLDSDQHPFQPTAYRLDKQLSGLIVACEPQWLEKGLEMSVEADPLTVEADPDLLSQVWVNLLHNAIKFTPEGGGIAVSVEAVGQQAVVRVADTGIGISEEDQPLIFQRFYKGDKSRTRTGGGSGLGLSIIQKIVEMHRGTIEVSSRVGEGTQMTVRLPLTHEPNKAEAPH